MGSYIALQFVLLQARFIVGSGKLTHEDALVYI